MKKSSILLVAIVAVAMFAGLQPSQVQAVMCIIYPPSTGATPLPAGLPALPLPAGAIVAELGNSYQDRADQNPTVTGTVLGGVQGLARGMLRQATALDAADALVNGYTGRIRSDVFYDTAGTRVVSSQTQRLTAAHQGYNGDTTRPYTYGSVAYPGYTARLGYVLDHGANIIILGGPINNFRNGDTYTNAIADYETIIAAANARGVWVVLQTEAYPQDGNSGYAANVPPFNAWVLAQSNRVGVKVLDLTSIYSNAGSDPNYFTGDGLHPSTIAVRAIAPLMKAVLQSMIAPSTTPIVATLDAANTNPFKGFTGTSGTLTNVTGTAPTGINMNRLSGSSTATASISEIATGNNKVTYTFTPVADGSATHTFGFRAISAQSIAAVGMAVGSWYETSVTVALGNEQWWDWMTTSDLQIVSAYEEQYDTTSLTNSIWPSFQYGGFRGKSIPIVQRNQVQTGVGAMRYSNRWITIAFPSAKAWATSGSIDESCVLTIISSGTIVPNFAIGDTVAGPNVVGAPVITALLTGTLGRAGTYQMTGCSGTAAAANVWVAYPPGTTLTASISDAVIRPIGDPRVFWSLP